MIIVLRDPEGNLFITEAHEVQFVDREDDQLEGVPLPDGCESVIAYVSTNGANFYWRPLDLPAVEAEEIARDQIYDADTIDLADYVILGEMPLDTDEDTD